MMKQKKVPPDIHFFEDPSLNTSPFVSRKLTRIIRFCSFGLVKNDAQAGFIVLLLTVGALVATYMFVKDRQTIEPTVYYEVLPQETVGSPQGLPPAPIQ